MLCKHNDFVTLPAERTPSTRSPENEGAAANKVLPQPRFSLFVCGGGEDVSLSAESCSGFRVNLWKVSDINHCLKFGEMSARSLSCTYNWNGQQMSTHC